MNSTSPAQTGTVAAVSTCLVALITTLNDRFNLGLTPQVQASLAGGIVVAGHWLAQQYAGYMAKRTAAKSPAPATPAA